jgi:holo-[acyl-carrier protein] synthase
MSSSGGACEAGRAPHARVADVAVGIDLVSLARVRRWVRRYDVATLGLVFTAREIDTCQRDSRPERRYASRFAAKEAVVKALGAAGSGARLDEIEIDVDPRGRVSVGLSGGTAAAAVSAGIGGWTGSCAATRRGVAAVVLADPGQVVR